MGHDVDLTGGALLAVAGPGVGAHPAPVALAAPVLAEAAAFALVWGLKKNSVYNFVPIKKSCY